MREKFRAEIRKTAESERDLYTADSDASYVVWLESKIKEVMEYGFDYVGTCEVKGVHWEKCHTLHYIQKGNITIDMLERMDVMNFISL